MLTIALEKVCFLIVKAREFDAKIEPVISDPGDNPTDDDARETLFDSADDATAEEIAGLIESLNIDEQAEVLALVWLGSGDYDVEEWEQALADARDAPESRRAESLLSIPLLADYLEEGLAELGYSCEDVERDHL